VEDELQATIDMTATSKAVQAREFERVIVDTTEQEQMPSPIR
jgi:hypothetical protein